MPAVPRTLHRRAARRQRHLYLSALVASAVGVPLAQWPATASAQATQASEQAFDIDLPAQPLAQALAALSRQTGVQVFAAGELVSGRAAPAVRGRFSTSQALDRLLAGSGLTAAAEGSAMVVRQAPVAAAASGSELPAITVKAAPEEESAIGPVQGYVAQRSATGTKTDTPLIETPQSISVITRDWLDVQNVQRFDEALRYTPGVNPQSFGFDIRQASIQLRGFFGTNQNIYRDGLQIRNPGFATFLTPEPYGAERIEVLRGPASVLYGQGGPSGLVNYVSKRPTLEPLREVGLEAGNFDRYAAKFDFGGPVDQDGILSYRLTGLARDSDTQVDFVPDDRIYIAPAITWRPSNDTSLTLLSHYQKYSTGDFQFFLPRVGTRLPSPFGRIPPSRFTGEPGFTQSDNDEYMVASLFEHRASDTWTFRQNARYYHFDFESKSVFASALRADGRTFDRVASTEDNEVDGLAVDNQAEARFTTGPLAHTMLFGLDFQRAVSDIQSGSGVGPPLDIFAPVYGSPVTLPPVTSERSQSQSQLGLYLQDQIKLHDRWVVSLGSRYDWANDKTKNKLTGTTTDRDDRKFTGRAGLLYLSDIGLAPYVSYSESFLPVGGTNVAGQPFQPETGRQYEAGIKYQPRGVKSFITLAGFELTRQNVLTPDLTDPMNRIQTGEVRSRGLELEAAASLTSGLDLIFAYTYLNAEVTQSNVAGEKGKRPTRVPEHLASLWADYTIRGGALSGVGAGGGARYTSSVFGDLLNTAKVPGVTLVDAALHYDWGRYRFALNVNNLFDREYFPGCSLTSCSSGLTRTVIGSVRYRF